MGRGGPARIVSIDVLRGLVMAVMALDHTRDFFGTSGFNPRDVMEPALFLTRWVTHLCAPTFILLAGAFGFSLWPWEECPRAKPLPPDPRPLVDLDRSHADQVRLEVRRRSLPPDRRRHLRDWSLDGGPRGTDLAVRAGPLPAWPSSCSAATICSMASELNSWAEGLGLGTSCMSPVWCLSATGANLYVLYPLIPWIGVMAAGYLLGPVMQLEGRRGSAFCSRLGAAVTLGFIVLRATNLYGDPAPWTAQETWLSTLLSFLNCEKYPPSLLYLMMTLGPALMLLASLRARAGRFRPLACHVRTSSVLLLCGPHLFDPCARRRHGPSP